jgi:hypothetical protein
MRSFRDIFEKRQHAPKNTDDNVMLSYQEAEDREKQPNYKYWTTALEQVIHMIVRDKEPESSKAGWKALGKEVETIIFEEKDDVAEVRKRLDLTLMLRIGDKMKEASRNAQGTKDMASGKHAWTTKPTAAPPTHQPQQRSAGEPQGTAGTPFAAYAVTNDVPYAALAVAMNAKMRVH